MTYECTVTPLTTRPEPLVYTAFAVEADSPVHAAQETAQLCAAQIEGTPGFIAPQRDGTFIASVGRQHPAHDGICTHGFSIKITVEPRA